MSGKGSMAGEEGEGLVISKTHVRPKLPYLIAK